MKAVALKESEGSLGVNTAATKDNRVFSDFQI